MQVKDRYRRAFGVCLGAATATAFVLAGTTPAQAEEGVVLNAGAPDTVPGLYIVGLHGATSMAPSAASAVSAQAGTLADRYGGDVRDVYSATLRGFSVHLDEQQAKYLAADPSVDFVQQSLWVRSATVGVQQAGEQPNPPSYGLDYVDGAQDDVYKYPNTGTGVHVYNTDSGLNLDHVEFEGRAKSGYDFVDEDDDVNDCKNQFDQGHGTHTAGTSSSEAYGVAKDVTVVGVKVLGCGGSAPDADSIQGIEWVTKNAVKPAIVNASWTSGGAGADPEGINRAINASIDSGITWVAAAGNRSADACDDSPAEVPRVITVAATDQNNNEASYSNHGSCVDLYAPGSSITSASNSDNSGTKGMSGTSMAAPHVTGGGALYLSGNPNASPQEVRDAIVNNARDGVVKNPGPGSPNKFLDVSKFGEGEPPVEGEPKAAFTVDCKDSLDCAFDAAGSTDEDGSIASYAWDFGDGKTGEGVNPAHTYAKAGEYRVTLTVTDNDGKAGEVTKPVRAGAPPAGQPPAASFTVQCQWDACTFDGTRSADPDSDIASYAWDFGDGKTGTGATTTHTYPNRQANYTAELTVTDEAGNTHTASKPIQCWSFGSRAYCFAQ